MTPSVPQVLLWVLGYFLTMIFYTFFGSRVYRRHFPRQSQGLAITTMILSCGGYLALLAKAGLLPPLGGVSLPGLLAALLAAPALCLLCDCGIDPLLEKRFPRSEDTYAQAIRRLGEEPVSGVFQAVILAPVMEELLMRGLVLGGLAPTLGPGWALLISALIFALLHFNLVQSLSALVCGLVLGLLFLFFGSLPCCMLAHSGYNLLSLLRIRQKYLR